MAGPLHQESLGARLIVGLDVEPTDVVVLTGTSPHCACFSAFRDSDKKMATGLAELLRAHRIDELCIGGLGNPEFVKVWIVVDVRCARVQRLLQGGGCVAAAVVPTEVVVYLPRKCTRAQAHFTDARQRRACVRVSVFG